MDIAEQGALLLVAAERRELEGVLKRCGRWQRLAWPVEFAACGQWRGRRWLLVANGPGPRLAGEAAAAALSRASVAAVISTGTCGALDPALAPGDILVAEEVRCLPAGGRFPARRPAGPAARRGVLLSVDRVVRSAEEKAQLRRSGADAVEMEAAGVAAEAERRSAPFYAIRAVLDGARESLGVDFNALRRADGRFSRARLLAAGLAHPAGAGRELLGLRRRLERAAENLGEFLAGCRF